MISPKHPAVGQLLDILTECALNGEPRPLSEELAARFRLVGNSAANELMRRLVERGDIVVEGDCIRNRVFVRSVGLWTGWLERQKRRWPRAIAFAREAEPATKRRKCIMSDCRREFDAREGEWYCPQCRRNRGTDDGLHRTWEYA